MLNPRILLTLTFKKMLCDNSRKISNPVPPALQWRRDGNTRGEINGVTLHNA